MAKVALCNILCPAAPVECLWICGRCRALLHVWMSCSVNVHSGDSIKHRECDSSRRKPSCPLAHFCGLASPWNRTLSHKEQKQVWGGDPAAQVYYDMFFITLFLRFASRSWFTERPVRNCGLETNIFFFFFFFRKAKVADAYEPIKCWLKSQHSLKVWGQDDIRTRSIRITLSGASSVRKRLFSCMATRWAWAHLHGEQSDRQ